MKGGGRAAHPAAKSPDLSGLKAMHDTIPRWPVVSLFARRYVLTDACCAARGPSARRAGGGQRAAGGRAHLAPRAVDRVDADLVVEPAVDLGRAVVEPDGERRSQLLGVRVRAIAPLRRRPRCEARCMRAWPERMRGRMQRVRPCNPL